MKKYDSLLAFGCSYTDGGGLNCQNFHRYLQGDYNYSKVNEHILEEHWEYARLNSYSGYLSRKLGCDFRKIAIGGGSNEWIFETAFNTLKDYKDKGNILAVIQTSHLHRRYIQIPTFNKGISVNQVEDLSGFGLTEDLEQIRDYFNLFITYFYDIDYEYRKVLHNMELFRRYYKDTNIDLVFLVFETPQNSVDYPPHEKDVIQTVHGDFTTFLRLEKLRICDLPHFPYFDSHASHIGNSRIADLIYKQLPGLFND